MPMCCSLPSPDFISILEVEPPSLVAVCSVLSPVLYGHKPWSHLPSSPPSDSSGYTEWAQFCSRLRGNLNQVMNVLRQLWEAVQTYGAVVCVAFVFSLLGKVWAVARQGLSQRHLLHIFFSFTDLPRSFFLSGDLRLYHPWWARDYFQSDSFIVAYFRTYLLWSNTFYVTKKLNLERKMRQPQRALNCLSVCLWMVIFFSFWSLISFSFFSVWGLLVKVWFSLNPIHLNSNTS